MKSLSAKYLKRLFCALLLMWGAMWFVGCEPDNPTPPDPTLEIAQELTGEPLESLILQFDAEAGSATFAVRSNRAWSATTHDADWCVVTPDKGDGDKTVTVAVSKNSGAARRAEITILTLLSKRSIYVEQSGNQSVDQPNGEPDNQPETPPAPSTPVVATADATDISTSTATLGGSYEFEGAIAEVGVAYRVAGTAEYIAEKSPAVQTTFCVTINALSAATEYEYYAYAVSDGKAYRGEIKRFATAKEASGAVAYFADDFSSVENNKVYTSPKWTFTSTDSAWPANAYMGWFGKIFDNEKFINIAPTNSLYSEVVAYAVMTEFNVADAESKILKFDLAWLFKTKDSSKFEVVASKNYAGDVAAATWEVIGVYTYTDEKVNPLNAWTTYSLDLSGRYAEERALTVAFRYAGKMNTYRLDNVQFGTAPIENE